MTAVSESKNKSVSFSSLSEMHAYNDAQMDRIRKEIRKIWLSCDSMKEFRSEYPKLDFATFNCLAHAA